MQAIALENEDELTRPVIALLGDMPAYRKIEAHQHVWGQLAFASAGILSINLPNGRFIVPPDKALWIPKNVMHEISTRYGAKFRSLYLAEQWSDELSSQAYVFTVSALLRELILAVVDLGQDFEMSQRNQHLLDLLLIEIKQAPITPLFIPMPTDRRLVMISDYLQQAPGDNTSLDQWQHRVGASIRTLNRLFNQQTGMGFIQWRQRLRLSYALELLSQGTSVTSVALAVGYESASAFITMFKKHLGVSPKAYLAG